MRRRPSQRHLKRLALAMTFVALAALSSGCEGEGADADWSLLPAAHAQAPGSNSSVISDVAERSLASVVHISTATKSKKRNYLNRGPWEGEHVRPQGLGSGVVVSRDGLVLTNNHVVKDADRILITLSNGRKYEAKVVGNDPKSDLAVIKLTKSPKGLRPIKIGDSAALRLGEFVLAIGNPFGLSGSVTMGIVSAKGRANVGIVDYEDFIQTDAAINPGNSGGALVNMRGELVGINTAILSRSGGYQGIGFAIPANMFKPIMKDLIKTGKVRRGWLGVSIEDVGPKIANSLGLKEARGVMIRAVQPGSPADEAGLVSGDVIFAIKGKEVNTSSRLRNLVALTGADKSTTFKIFRKGKTKVVKVKLGILPN